MTLPKKVTLVEVGPRDGLQSEKVIVSAQDKLTFIDQLAQTGLTCIEITSFSSEKQVPQFADHDLILQHLKPYPNVIYPVIIPTFDAMQHSLELAKLDHIAVLLTASETFSERNTHCSIKEGMQRAKKIIQLAKQHGIHTRAYLSCAVACPYEGDITPQRVSQLTQDIMALGYDQIALSDTIGIATPAHIQHLLDTVLKQLAVKHCAVHFHDTYGQAIANIHTALTYGITTIDCAVAGLGGCPYAPGASGNVATEDVVYLMQGLDIETGIDLQQLVNVGFAICDKLGKTPSSRVANALGRV